MPIEGLALSDADAMDACYGYVSIVRCVTFCVHRDVTIERTIDGSREWQCRYERVDWLATGIGRSTAAARFERMRLFLDSLAPKLEAGERASSKSGERRCGDGERLARRPGG